jgi:hypothetical protein
MHALAGLATHLAPTAGILGVACLSDLPSIPAWQGFYICNKEEPKNLDLYQSAILRDY